MKKHVYFFLIFSIFSHIFLSAADTGKTRLAILPFSSMGSIDKATVEVISENFTVAMVDAGVYSIVERGQLNKALNELKFQRGDVFDDSSAAELGKMAGAQIVIFGSVSYASDTYFINARGIDVTTGVVAFGKREQTKNKNELFAMVDKLAISISFGTDIKLTNTKKNSSDSTTGNFNSNEQAFIKKYYDRWGISTDNYEDSRYKFKFFIGVGIGVLALGGTLILAGIIAIPVLWNQPYKISLPVDIGFLVAGFVTMPFSIIPFWYSSKVATIYRKSTGERLSFWNRTKFDLRIVTTKESLTNEYNRKISFDLSMGL